MSDNLWHCSSIKSLDDRDFVMFLFGVQRNVPTLQLPHHVHVIFWSCCSFPSEDFTPLFLYESSWILPSPSALFPKWWISLKYLLELCFRRKKGRVVLPFPPSGFFLQRGGLKQIIYQCFLTHINKSFTHHHIQLETLGLVIVLICHKQQCDLHPLFFQSFSKSEPVRSFILIGPNFPQSWCLVVLRNFLLDFASSCLFPHNLTQL